MSALQSLLVSSGLPTREVVDDGPDDIRSIYLYAGQLHVSATPLRIVTILGSCLAMGVWDALTGIGGMNHYMLPQDVGTNCSTPRYARTAIERLMTELALAGADWRRLQARLFGGACVMASFQKGGLDLGGRNVEVARRYLESTGIPIVSEDVGGVHGRKVVFRTDTGMAMVRKV